MNCPKCQHGNPDEARFCAQCGAPLTQPAPVMPTTQTPAPPAAQPARRRHTGLIALAVVVLLVVLGGYATFHQATGKAETPTAAAPQNAARPNDSGRNAAAALPRTQARGTALGAPVGGGATGAPDQAKAPDNPAQPGQQSEQQDKSSGSTSGTPGAAGDGQAAGAMGGLLGALSTAVGGVHRHDPVDFHTLETLLPSSLSGMQGAAPDGKADDTMSIKTTTAHVDFTGSNGARLKLSITDATAISGLAGLADMANSNSSEQGDSYEKTETIDGRSVREKWDAPARHGELSLSVGQRFAVDVVGDNVDMDALKNALAHIDLAKLESMKDANPLAK